MVLPGIRVLVSFGVKMLPLAGRASPLWVEPVTQRWHERDIVEAQAFRAADWDQSSVCMLSIG